jgi:6-phosphogluconate dehydrogenase
MVWARTKLMIEDDLLRPLPAMSIKFSGLNPERFYKEIYNLLLVSFRLSEDAIQEKDFQWNKGESDKFKISWEINKDLDKFSYYFINVSLSGESSKGSGKAEIEVDGVLRTEYPQDTYWQRSLLYEILSMFWHTTFYNSQRVEYIKEGRRLLSLFCNQVKALARV